MPFFENIRVVNQLQMNSFDIDLNFVVIILVISSYTSFSPFFSVFPNCSVMLFMVGIPNGAEAPEPMKKVISLVTIVI